MDDALSGAVKALNEGGTGGVNRCAAGAAQAGGGVESWAREAKQHQADQNRLNRQGLNHGYARTLAGAGAAPYREATIGAVLDRRICELQGEVERLQVLRRRIEPVAGMPASEMQALLALF